MISYGKIKANIGFIGPGKMAEAILGGILKADVAKNNQIFTYARREERREQI